MPRRYLPTLNGVRLTAAQTRARTLMQFVYAHRSNGRSSRTTPDKDYLAFLVEMRKGIDVAIADTELRMTHKREKV